MKKTYDVAVQGLDEWLVGQPLVTLINWINANTPAGIHFIVVGGTDPQLQQSAIEQNMIDAYANGEVPILIGHSKGAMEAFYAAMRLKVRGIRSPLFVSIDSTGWGTNAPGVPEWATIVLPPNTGKWFVPDNVDVWIHAYQDGLPGGGVASLAPGNTTTDLRIIHCPTENHISIVNCDPVRKAILDAVLAAAA